jgi:hypothetical protein
LRNHRVIAVDKTLSPADKPVDVRHRFSESDLRKTVTLETTECQAAMLLVSDLLGKDPARAARTERGAQRLCWRVF